MATLGRDPRYRALATAAASILGSSSSSIIAAVLAQWQCEQPGGPPWPPVHNNPGFVTVGAIRSVGLTIGSYARTSPGVNFLATFATPSEGATAYAQLLARGARYAPSRAAIARGDGAGFLRAVTSAGYGTRYSCAISAYKALGGSVTAGGSLPTAETVVVDAPPVGTTRQLIGTVTKIIAGRSVSTCSRPPVPTPTGSGPFGVGTWDGVVYPIPPDRLSDPCACPTGYNRAVYEPQLFGLFGTNYVPIPQLPAGGANACLRADQREGSLFGNRINDVATGTFDAIAGAIADAAFTVVVLGGIVILLLLGSWITVREAAT